MQNSIKKVLKNNRWAFGSIRYFLNLYEAIKGTREAQCMQREALMQDISIKQGVATIQRRWPDIEGAEQESPIFIMSAGWRSGSTLLQRLIMSKENILVWGEPYSHAGLLDGLASTMKAFTSRWPADDWFICNYDQAQLSHLWVANLYPEVRHLQTANTDFLSALFKTPANDLGFERWGIKDVRLTIDHAQYLKWLYPRAKFLFLYRNPYHAYISYRPARDWYKKWPDQPVFTPAAFASHWAELVSGYIEGYQCVGGMLIKYEDLISGQLDIDGLQDYLSIDIDTAVLDTMVGGSNVSHEEVPRFELAQIRKVVEPLASELGYSYRK